MFPCNWDAVQLFLRVANQLRRAGCTGVPVAIDHNCVWKTMAAMDHPLDLTLFDQFLVMEDATISELQKSFNK